MACYKVVCLDLEVSVENPLSGPAFSRIPAAFVSLGCFLNYREPFQIIQANQRTDNTECT